MDIFVAVHRGRGIHFDMKSWMLILFGLSPSLRIAENLNNFQSNVKLFSNAVHIIRWCVKSLFFLWWWWLLFLLPLEKVCYTHHLVLITYITPKGRLIFQFLPHKNDERSMSFPYMRFKKNIWHARCSMTCRKYGIIYGIVVGGQFFKE